MYYPRNLVIPCGKNIAWVIIWLRARTMSQTRITQFGTVGDKPLHLVQSQTQATGNLSANHSGDGRDTSTDGRALSDGLSKTRGKKKSLKKNKKEQRKVKRKPTEPPRSNSDASITEILGPSLNELLAPSTPMPNGRSGSAPSDSSMTSPQATSSPTLTAGPSNSSPKHRGRGYSKQPGGGGGGGGGGGTDYGDCSYRARTTPLG